MHGWPVLSGSEVIVQAFPVANCDISGVGAPVCFRLCGIL